MSQPPNAPRRLRVAVLMGGTSNERAVSLSTGKMILSALDPDRYEVTAIDTQDILALTANRPGMIPVANASPVRATTGVPTPEVEIAAPGTPAPSSGSIPAKSEIPGTARPDVVFIALHGKGGEDGTIQGMLELLGLPYTGSGVLASALAMDKSMTKRLLRHEKLPVIPDITFTRAHGLTDDALIHRTQEALGSFPVFVKPNAEGSTFGCSLVEQPDRLPDAVATALKYDALAIVEKYIPGIEITAGVLGNAGEELQALPLIEIVPKSAFYDYESKYADGGSEHILPARIPVALTARAQEIALQCHTLLGCRGMSRTDMIVSGETLFVLEINTIPGMTPTSLLPQAASEAGISFPDLLDRILRSAL